MIKKLSPVILSGVLCVGNTSVFASNAQTSVKLQINNPMMTVNGVEKEIYPDGGAVPVIINGRTLLPMRAIIEELGGSVDWNGDKREITLNYADDEIRLAIDSTTAYINDEERALDAAPAIINNRAMAPVRFIAESFGFGVEWNDDDQTATIKKTAKEPESIALEKTENPPNDVTSGNAPSDNQTQESKILVAYFSSTGATEGVAESLASATGAQTYKIEAAQPYTSEDLNYDDSSSRATTEQNSPNARPAISNLPESLNEYDVIYLGYPIWWGQAPKIIYTFLESYDFTGKTIIPFCTSGSSDIGSSDDNLRSSANGANWVEGKRFSGGAPLSEVSAWATELTKQQ